MNEMKYIMINYNRPVLFLDTWAHDEVARMFTDNKHKVTSAGFVRRDKQGSLYCCSESISLKLKPAEGDEKIIMESMGAGL